RNVKGGDTTPSGSPGVARIGVVLTAHRPSRLGSAERPASTAAERRPDPCGTPILRAVSTPRPAGPPTSQARARGLGRSPSARLIIRVADFLRTGALQLSMIPREGPSGNRSPGLNNGLRHNGVGWSGMGPP